MNAKDIINDIKNTPVNEQVNVVSFARSKLAQRLISLGFFIFYFLVTTDTLGVFMINFNQTIW